MSGVGCVRSGLGRVRSRVGHVCEVNGASEKWSRACQN